MNPYTPPPSKPIKPTGRFSLWLILTILSVLAVFPLVTISFSLISARDDIAMSAGFIMLALLIGGIVWLAPKFARKLRGAAQVIAILLALLSFTSCERINAGYAGIKVNNYGAQRGVEDVPLVTGWVWYNPMTQNVVEYPCFVQTAAWDGDEAFTFNLSGGIIAKADISFSYQFTYEKVPAFWIKFRSDAIRVENELRATTAEAQKTIARAKGEAESNLLITKSISPELVQWRTLDIQQRAIEKWNGVRPSVESGSGSGLMIQIPTPAAPQK